MSTMIHTPGVVSVQDHGANSATFVLEPLHTGYGMTLGNSLRRVLLSSIAGSAVTAFKIEGVTHEFTTLKGVKEDMIDLMLNLKGVRFRIFNENIQQLRLVKKGKGPITAADIELNADVEVVNPEHVIANVDDTKTNFVMDMVVEAGRGYRTIDDATARKASDMIAVDAIFSPVLRVRYKVENTRVGQITDLDKLLLTVDTDGSISPREAFEEAAAILVNQYTALAGQTRVENPVAATTNGSPTGDDDTSHLMTSIEDLTLSARTTNALINNDIQTLNDLVSLSDTELRELKGFGSKALDEVKDKLAELEL